MQQILFVDDERHILDGLQRVLRSKMVECAGEGVTSAAEALKRVADGQIDVIVSDVRMPEMDGIELLTRLKGNAETQNIPVIMLTGHADSSAKRVALELGAYDFVDKPADPAELAARLRSALRLKSYQDRLCEQNQVLEQQLIHSQRLEIVGLLAAGVLHDLRNILTNMIGRTEVTACRMSDNPELQEDLESIVDAGNHATRLVEQIMQLGKPESILKNICDLGDMVESSLELLKSAIPHGISLDWHNQVARGFVRADTTQIHQVLMNLCFNAVDAMNGAGAIRITLTEEPQDPEAAGSCDGATISEYLKLEVLDTGRGMDKETLDHIFDPFFTTKRPEKGSGLGLSVVHRIVKNLGGRITAKSELGRGTTFSVYLPQSTDHVSNESSERAGIAIGKETNPIRR